MDTGWVFDTNELQSILQIYINIRTVSILILYSFKKHKLSQKVMTKNLLFSKAKYWREFVDPCIMWKCELSKREKVMSYEDYIINPIFAKFLLAKY